MIKKKNPTLILKEWKATSFSQLVEECQKVDLDECMGLFFQHQY